MDINIEELRKHYADLNNEELLRLHASGELTDIAYSVLEKELSSREIPIPQRPSESEIATGWPQSLRAHWEGKASLASAYWFLWWLGSFVFAVFIGLAVNIGARLIAAILFLFYLAYLVFAVVSVWRCAWNTTWKGWGYLARAWVISLLIPIALAPIPFILWGIDVATGSK